MPVPFETYRLSTTNCILRVHCAVYFLDFISSSLIFFFLILCICDRKAAQRLEEKLKLRCLLAYISYLFAYA